MIPKRRTDSKTVARRRQQGRKLDEAFLDGMTYRIWCIHTTASARDLGNTRRHPSVTDRWGAAMAAAKAGALVEGQSA